MTSLRPTLRPPDAQPRTPASLVVGVSVSERDRTGDHVGPRSTVRAEAAVVGAVVVLPLRKVR